MSKASVKAVIDAAIKQNGTKSITGSVLNSVLNQMVDEVPDVVNDKTTGGTTKAWSAEQGKDLSADVSQLAQEVDGTGNQTQIQHVLSLSYAIINKNNGAIEYNSTSTTTVRKFKIPETITAIKVSGRKGTSASGCMVSFFKGDELLGTDLPNTGTGTNVVKMSVSLPKGTDTIYIAGSSASSGQNGELYSIDEGLTAETAKQWEAIEADNIVAEKSRSGLTIKPLPAKYTVKYYAGINATSGNIVTTNNAPKFVVKEFDIPAGVSTLRVNGRRGASNTRAMLAYYEEDGTFISSDVVGIGSNARNYIGYESTVPVDASFIRVAGAEDDVPPEVFVYDDSVEIEESEELNILCFGNSYTYDAFGYLPDIAKRAFPKIKLNIAIMYQGHCSLQEHLANITDGTKYPECSIYYADSGKWHTETSRVSAEEILSVKAWDIILLQQNSANSTDYSTFQPYLGQIIDKIYEYISYPVKFGWLLTPAWAEGYSSLVGTSDAMYEGIVSCVERVLDETPVEFAIPVGTATQNARHTSLDSLGTFGHLTYDGTHLNEGIPCLNEAYAALLSLASLSGKMFRSIIGDSTRPTDAWITGQAVPGTNGSSVGVTDANVLLAQKCAIMAHKHPFEITEGIE